MSSPRFLPIAVLAALAGAAHAAPPQDVDLDGSAGPAHRGTLAAKAGRQLRADDVPSAKGRPVDVKAQADADIAARDARAKGPRLHVERQNLKGDDAARALRQAQTPNTIDRATAYGDKDHTEQVTDLKVTIRK